jgi:hypothetical protein
MASAVQHSFATSSLWLPPHACACGTALAHATHKGCTSSWLLCTHLQCQQCCCCSHNTDNKVAFEVLELLQAPPFCGP